MTASKWSETLLECHGAVLECHGAELKQSMTASKWPITVPAYNDVVQEMSSYTAGFKSDIM